VTNTIEIRAVRAKDWSWWYVALVGTERRVIAEGGYCHPAHRYGPFPPPDRRYGFDYRMQFGLISTPGYIPVTAESSRELIKKLYRRLGVKKLDWEIVDQEEAKRKRSAILNWEF